MEPITYAWLTVGLVPYHIAKRYPTRHVRTITLRALFWTLDIRTTRTLAPTRRRARPCAPMSVRVRPCAPVFIHPVHPVQIVHRPSYIPHSTFHIPHRTSSIVHRTSHIPHRPAPRTAWTLRIPLIERLRDAVWAAVARLKGSDI